MKTLTELSGSAIRVAAAAIAEARRSLPTEEKPAAPAITEAPAQGTGTATGDAPARTAASVEAPAATADAPARTAASVEAPAATADPAVATPVQPAPASPREAESGAAKEAIDAAVAKATGLSGDRLTMMQGAVEAVGRRIADVRLVRVFGLEEQVTGATTVGAYQYVVDLFPASMQQVTAPRDDRGRRGGGRGGGKGGGDRGIKGSGVGGFSMDSLREDRKNERGGRGGPGRGRRSGGGGPGGPPGGAPKK